MKNKGLLASFYNALSGVAYTVKNERNMKIHISAAIIVFALSIFYRLPKVEFILICLTVALVMACELFNTALELVVDSIYKEYHPIAKVIKDVSAGAVILAAIIAVVVGYFIFFDRIFASLKSVINGVFFKIML